MTLCKLALFRDPKIVVGISRLRAVCHQQTQQLGEAPQSQEGLSRISVFSTSGVIALPQTATDVCKDWLGAGTDGEEAWMYAKPAVPGIDSVPCGFNLYFSTPMAFTFQKKIQAQRLLMHLYLETVLLPSNQFFQSTGICKPLTPPPCHCGLTTSSRRQGAWSITVITALKTPSTPFVSWPVHPQFSVSPSGKGLCSSCSYWEFLLFIIRWWGY